MEARFPRGPAEAFRARLLRGPCLRLDGGLGSLLLARGLAPGQPPEPWSLERPELVAALHREYVEAGSEAVHTNTFGAHPLRLERHGLAARCAELNGAAVKVARAAGARFVIGDLGPAAAPGAPEDVEPGYDQQIRALAEAGADALHAETFSDLRQAEAVVRAARRQAPALALIVSMTFERRAGGFFTLTDRQPAECFAVLRDAGADAVGANCWLSAEPMAELASGVLEDEGLRLVVQPCSGPPDPAGSALFAAVLAPLAPRLAGLGGCCGTDARFIAALSARLGERPADSGR